MDDENINYLWERGGRFAISRWIGGRWIHLLEDGCLEYPEDARAVLYALSIQPTERNLSLYFPMRKGRRCPTLALLERCNVLDPTNPMLKKERVIVAGV